MNENTTGDSMRTPTEPAVLNDPLRNRGVAFTLAEREALGLTGRLPSGVLTLEEQAHRTWQQLQAQGGRPGQERVHGATARPQRSAVLPGAE